MANKCILGLSTPRKQISRNMHSDGHYIILKYRDLPEVDFICESRGSLRIKVSRISRSELKSLPGGFLLGVIETSILVFESVGDEISRERDRIVKAVQWYKKQAGLDKMRLLYLEA